MSLFLIIPVKGLHAGKSRLAPILSSQERYELNQYLLKHTLEIARQLLPKEKIIVISSCAEALMAAKDSAIILEEKKKGLNHALEQATEYAKTQGATQLLILPTDLPRMTVEDLKPFKEYKGFVIVPDREQAGTNALFLNLHAGFSYKFGNSSLDLHLQEAERLGLKFVLEQNENLAFDLDTCADYHLIVLGLTIPKPE